MLGMLLHYENITKLMSGAQVSVADIDAEESLFRHALARWDEVGEPVPSATAQLTCSDWVWSSRSCTATG